MSKIDERIVELKFNTAQFEQGVKSTQENLNKLNDSLQMEGASKGLEEVANSVGKIESKFSILGAMGLTAIMELTKGAIGFGQKIAGAVLDPLVEGGKKRAQNIEQAKFQFRGLGMDVEQSMADAQFAVQGTSYGLDEAAVAASQFGASGIQSGTEMQTALRGIAGVAAMAGTSYSDMANVFTKVAGQGRLMGDDLNRLGNRGIGAASTIADYLNEMGLAANATEADVREMVTKGQIDFKTFAAAMSGAFGEHATKANETYAGSLSNLKAALSRVGEAYYTPKMEQSRKIFISLARVVDELAKGLKPLIAGFVALTDIGADNLISFLDSLDFTDFIGGMALLTEAIGLFSAFVVSVTTPIKAAFNDVFGGEQVTIFTKLGTTLLDFAKSLKVTEDGAKGIQSVFTTFFSLLKGGFTILVSVGKVVYTVISAIVRIFIAVGQAVLEFFGFLKPLTDGFQITGTEAKSFSETVGILTDKIVTAINKGVEPLITGLNWLRDAFAKLITVPTQKFFDKFAGSAEGAATFGDIFMTIVRGIRDAVVGLWNVVSPVFGKIGEALKKLGSAFSNLDFSAISSVVNSGFIGVLTISLVKLFKSGAGAVDAVKEVLSFKKAIIEVFDGITGALKAMQNDLNAKALIKIAAAIGILALSMLILSTIDGARIATSLGGMAGMAVILVGMTAALAHLTGVVATAKLPVIAAALIGLSISILLLSVALKILGTMSWDEIARGLVALGGGVIIMVGAMLLLGLVGPRIIFAALALGAISFAIITLSLALKILGTMSWDEIGRGLVALAGGMLILVGSMLLLSLVGPRILFAAVALAAICVTLLVLTVVLKILGSMSWEEIGKGLVALAGGLLLMVGAVLLLSFAGPGVLLGVIALIAVSVAILALSAALTIISNIKWSALWRGLTGLAIGLALMVGAVLLLGLMGPLAILGAVTLLMVAAALGVLVISITTLGGMDMASLTQGLTALVRAIGIMVGAVLLLGIAGPLAILGAAAMLIMAAALAIMAAVLVTLGSLPAEAISQGLGAIAAALGIMIGLGTALGLLSPVLLLGAIALAALGIAMILVGAGIFLVSIAIGMLAGVAPQAATALTTLGEAVVAAIVYVPAMIGMAVALLLFGVGALVAGIGAVVLGVGLMVLSLGLALLGVTAPMGAAGLETLTSAMVAAIPHAGEFAVMGASLIALGIGFIIFGVGALLAGAGLLVFGSGLAMMAKVGPKGAEALAKVVEKVAGLTGQAIKLGIMSAALGLLGAALLLTGVGSLLSGVGLMMVAMSLMMLLAVYPGAVAGLKAVNTAVTTLSANQGTITSLAAGLLALGVGFTLIAVSGRTASSGIKSMVTASTTATVAVQLLAATVTGMIPAMVATFAQIGPSTLATAAMVGVSMRALTMAVVSSIGPTMAAAMMLAMSLTMTLTMAISAGRGSVYAAAIGVGLAVSAGMAVGIRSGASMAISAAAQVAAEALAAAKAELDINSPSRKFEEVGMWSDKGLAKGFLKNKGVVTDASAEVAGSAMSTLRNAMSSINEAVFSHLDDSPTIKPILDLSGVAKEASSLGALLGAPALATAGIYADVSRVDSEIRQTREEREKPNPLTDDREASVTNITQNNYSPKTLSASELYRNTKSLVATAKEAGKDDHRGVNS